MNKILFSLISLFCLFGLASGVHAALDINERYHVTDIEISTLEYKTDTNIEVKVGREGSETARYLGKVNLGNFPKGQEIEKALLKVRGNSTDSGISFQLQKVVTPWDIRTVTGNTTLNFGNAAVTGTKTLLSSFGNKTFFEVVFDVTDISKEWFEKGNEGFMIQKVSEGSAGVAFLGSANRSIDYPFLEITYGTPREKDLTITFAGSSNDIFRNEPFTSTFFVTVRNSGQVALDLSRVIVSLFVYDRDNQFIAGTSKFAGLSWNAGEEKNVFLNGIDLSPNNRIDKDSIILVARVDTENVIKENNEDNNVFRTVERFLTTRAVVAPPKAGPSPAGPSCEQNLEAFIKNPSFEVLSRGLNVVRNTFTESQNYQKYITPLKKGLAQSNTTVIDNFLVFYVSYGCDYNTYYLGEGERTAVLESFKRAFGNVPQNKEEMLDIIKISTGRLPSRSNVAVEKIAFEDFLFVFKRPANLVGSRQDKNTIHIMAYGIRQTFGNRRLPNERVAITTFKSLYKRVPKDARDWNIVQGIAYGGSKR
ncbi:MAG: hypothetical protein G01um101418_929 [Parcubacteria group bacterium Gr01-1014_18]|nr:MAG: hypothetical protein Greene041636_908 [Parcubacteria group bacterium Greene0416_36]TSC79765.1 MAG: hypothetical protein G01um101418_929 [Parcubacteria group bacterium Gr01-1014_18]TSC97967.1 MAG: hypothetical protein Greene101420_924 [Parcubacteria group bacterium Greene1014_20]TSD06019.1 MAG: hypothetical protein Greene07142_950 [Parcubacteria group bacterium Greene0714_2]